MAKLTKNQRQLLDTTIISNAVGREAYVECGRCKPYSTSTVRSLVKRGLINARPKIFGQHGGVQLYYVSLNPGEGDLHDYELWNPETNDVEMSLFQMTYEQAAKFNEIFEAHGEGIRWIIKTSTTIDVSELIGSIAKRVFR